MGKKQKQKKNPCAQCRIITTLYLDPSDGNSYCRDCWVQCYGVPPVDNVMNDDEPQPKGPAVAPPPPADFWAADQGRSDGKGPSMSADAVPWSTPTHSAPTHQIDSNDGQATEEAAQAMATGLLAALSDGASTTDLIESMEGKTSDVSLYTLLMSAKTNVREVVLENLPQIVSQLANKANEGGQGDAGGWLYISLVERALCCGNADKRTAAIDSIGKVIRYLKPDTTNQCVRETAAYVRAAIARTGKEATTGKLASFALLQVLCQESSNGAIEAVAEAKDAAGPGTALRTALEQVLYPAGGTSKETPLLQQVFQMLGQGSKEVQAAALGAASAAVAFVLPQPSIQRLVALLNRLMTDKKWQVKYSAVSVVGDLARQGPTGWEDSASGKGSRLKKLEFLLPELIPPIIELMRDSKPEVAAAAEAALLSLGHLCSNPETVKLREHLLSAIIEPDKTEDTLSIFMKLTFVNALDAPSLAIIVPVIARAMVEGNGSAKQKGAAACGTMCTLVKETAILEPFVPFLMPGLRKACEHSRPDVREAAEEATKLLEEGLKADHGRSTLARQSSTADYMVCLEGMILAFAGRVLLQHTNLFLERGHRYAVIGNNGVGKTTLLNSLAAKNINNFPMEVRTHYITHEIPAEEQAVTCEEFMRKAISPMTAPDERRVQGALDKVGFAVDPISGLPMRQKPITELSGGWRMKLTVARSMLNPFDLLLLDEPTNHLDRSSIAWLQHYLVTEVGAKQDVTICVVSHDYSFLDVVVTDVLHICDKKLTNYPCGFKAFQKQRPEIMQALTEDNAEREGARKAASSSVDGAAVGGAGAGGAGAGAGEEEEEPRVNNDSLLAAGLTPQELAKLRRQERLERAAKEAYAKALKQGEDTTIGNQVVLPMKFPNPGKLDGIKSVRKPVVTFKDIAFQYPSADTPQLTGVNATLRLNSRVVIVGANGAGKTTLLKLLVGETLPTRGVGELSRHHNLRMSYIAQHSMHHIEDSLSRTPMEYLRYRFYQGQDRELQKMNTIKLTEEEEEKMTKRGEVCEVVSRVERGREMWYELLKTGRGKKDTKWTSLMEIGKTMDPYVMKLVRNYDEKAKTIASGMDVRPLTTSELKKHLEDFGIDSHLATQTIGGFSGGQKARLVLAAAMWSMPHMIALDEPTNYLDNDTLAALTRELKSFKGAVVAVSHHPGFVNALCTERWTVVDGKLDDVTQLAKTKNDLPDFVPDRK